jgi:hypothetical protein
MIDRASISMDGTYLFYQSIEPTLMPVVTNRQADAVSDLYAYRTDEDRVKRHSLKSLSMDARRYSHVFNSTRL